MRIDREEVRRIASLASLEFDADRELAIASEMSHILDYIDQLGEADISRIAADAEPAPTPLRDDIAAHSLPTTEVAANAPQFTHGLFVVPKIIGGE
jgi:aspartyl-tRNA(Asn)/glutamyl-tRNA(Gln) amidotransferase subunit C